MTTIQKETASNEQIIKAIQVLNKYVTDILQLNISNDGNIVKINNMEFKASRIKKLLFIGILAESLCTKLIVLYLQGDTATKYTILINKLANGVYQLAYRILGKENIYLNIVDIILSIDTPSWYGSTIMRLIHDLYEVSQILQSKVRTTGHNTVANAIITINPLISLLRSSISLTGDSRIPKQQSKL